MKKPTEWPLENWGRVRVMLHLFEQSGLFDINWESKNYNYSQLPVIYEIYQEDSDYPLNIILGQVSKETVKAILEPYLTHMTEIIKDRETKLVLNLSNNERQSIKNEIMMLKDRVDYVKECMEKLEEM